MVTRDRRGMTLGEALVATALIAVAALAFSGAFRNIAKGLFVSRAKSLAAHLAQERIESLKNKTYYRLWITKTPQIPVAFQGLTPDVLHDPDNYDDPPITAGGITFTRCTIVQKVKNNGGNFQTVDWDQPDTGIKRIVTTVLWREDGRWKRLTLQNLLESADMVHRKVEVRGAVTSLATGGPLQGAYVDVLENPLVGAVTDAAGAYRLEVSPGVYTLRASRGDCFTRQTGNVPISQANAPLTKNFALTTRGLTSVSGTVWKNDHLLLSRVTGRNDESGFAEEWVEVYNPTTWTWVMKDQIGLLFQRRPCAGSPCGPYEDPAPLPVAIDYLTPQISTGGFYLFANRATVHAGGVAIPADAVWSAGAGSANLSRFGAAGNRQADAIFTPAAPNLIPVWEDANAGGQGEGIGGLALVWALVPSSPTIDAVGWTGNGALPPGLREGSAFGTPHVRGLRRDDQLSRFSSTAGFVVNGSYGPAYDSDDSGTNWEFHNNLQPNRRPRNSLSPLPAAPLAGTPVPHALVFSNDRVSLPVKTTLVNSPGTSRAYASFTLTNVATGTWTVTVSSGAVMGTRVLPVALAGTPVLPVVLRASGGPGYVTGRVTTVLGGLTVPLSMISVQSHNPPTAGDMDRTDTDGRYILRYPPDPDARIVVNGGMAHPAYMESGRGGLTVAQGDILTGIDFTLYPSVILRGRTTTDGVNPLPGTPVRIVEQGLGTETAQVISDVEGYFETPLSTGNYTVQPIPERGENIAPPFENVSLMLPGATVFSTTFTLSTAFGAVEGTVTAGGQPLTTGALLLVTNQPLTGTPPYPPPVTAALRGSNQSYYMTVSHSDGTFRLLAPAGVYTLHGWYQDDPDAGVPAEYRFWGSVTVTAGNASSASLSW